MIDREVRVGFVSSKLKRSFDELKLGKYESKKLFDFITRAINDLKLNPLCGIKIPKKLWAKEYVKKYGVSNLWKYDLPNGWRLIYTIETDEVRIVSIVLEWFSHKGYERRFGY